MIKPKLLFILFLLFYAAILVKLFYLQILQTSSTEVTYLKTNKIPPERGKIYDRNGEPLAVNNTTYLLYIEPKLIKNKDEVKYKLDSLLHIGDATLEAKFDETKDWMPIQGKINKEQKQKILSLGLKGIGFEDEYQRYYPEGSLSAHLLGFVGKDTGGEDIGYFGIEGFYDKELVGLPGVMKTDRDIFGKPILIGTQQKLDPINGRDLYLTIDSSIQEFVKKKLITGLETYKAKEGCVIVTNPNTLEILALTCLPDFDAKYYYEFTEEFFKNPAISNLYEPGSTFKPFIMSAAIEERKVKPDDFYNESGPIGVTGYTIRTWNNKYEGKISLTHILEKSSNVGIVYVGQKLGNDKIFSYLERFGFGRDTGIDLQGEATGYLKPKNSWYPIDFVTVTFGQGIAVTPIQMVQAFSSLINGGKLLEPYVVKKVVFQQEEKIIKPTVKRTVMSKKTSDIIKKMLLSTVEKGEVKWLIPKGYKIAGKTGTAQIPIEGHYDPTKTVASFIGFAPVTNPQFLALVVLREPKTSSWGSETAAPLFFEIAKELLVYYNIAPE